jgi:Type III restriction enzyme, res subunit
VSAGVLPQLFDELEFGGEWRRYQKAAIAAFERNRAAGRRRTHIVAPPGSGKTLVGVELVRRVGRRARAAAAAEDGATRRSCATSGSEGASRAGR